MKVFLLIFIKVEYIYIFNILKIFWLNFLKYIKLQHDIYFSNSSSIKTDFDKSWNKTIVHFILYILFFIK